MPNIKEILKKSIHEFNSGPKKFIQKLENEYPNSEIKYELKRELDKNIRKVSLSRSLTNKAINSLKKHNFVKNKVELIANDFLVRKKDMENLLTREVFKTLENQINIDDLKVEVLDYLQENSFKDSKGFSFIRNNISKDAEQFLPYILRDGFDQDFVGLEVGTNSSNEGDGAEHLFVAKAMIAGFNCSVVDIGSSKYDAVIEDKNGDLLKVQVKSYGKKGVFSRRGRDRGGQGIDSSNPSNKGSLVTSENCDIFVAVNKSNGEIIIFSKDEIDSLPEKSIKRTDYPNNWENWSKINQAIK